MGDAGLSISLTLPTSRSQTHLFYVGEGVVEEAADDGHVDEVTDYDGEGEDDEAAELLAEAAESAEALFLMRVSTQQSKDALYEPISTRAADSVEAGSDGLIWHAQLVGEDYKHPKHVLPSGELKPRRPMPQARASAFFDSLVHTQDGRFIFGGVLNGWPALTSLELRAITVARRTHLGGIKRLYDAGKAGAVPTTPEQIATFVKKYLRKHSVRVTLRAPQWTGRGWSPDSPGHAYWFAACDPRGPRLVAGSAMVTAGDSPRAKLVHMFGHRYAKAKESAADRLTWHSGLLIEWEHTEHCSVVELAWYNGLAGYGGKSNFALDRDEARPALYDAFPPGLKGPWVNNRAEIRVLDIPVRNKEEFITFLAKHTGPTKRFLEPSIRCVPISNSKKKKL